MTPPIDDRETLRHILANTDALLLDFDGPICNVFSGFPAPIVADQLRAILAQGGHTNLPAEVATATDPFDILFYAATLGPEEAHYVEAAFRAHEVEAIQTAQPTPGAHDLIHAWRSVGRPIAIVSNNSRASINTYLEIHGLADLIRCIAARVSADIALLKPAPHLLLEAARTLQVSVSDSVLLGDSPSDLAAAQKIAMPCIGFVNKPSKAHVLQGADVLVSRLPSPQLIHMIPTTRQADNS